MLTLIANQTPSWMLILYICSGDPNLDLKPEQDPNFIKHEEATYSIVHCQNALTLATARPLPPNTNLRKGFCREITKLEDPNLG